MPEHIELPFIPESFKRTARPFPMKRIQRNSQEKQKFYQTSGDINFNF
jgi:hypothetical protein